MRRERWKKVQSFNGYYFISSNGRVRSIGRTVKRGNGTIPVKEKIMKGAKNSSGYITVTLSDGDNKKSCFVHRLVGEYFVKNPKRLKEFNHKNGIKTDNHASNIEPSTRSKNAKHAYDNGLNHCTTNRQIVVQGDKRIVFNSIVQASKELGISRTSIYKALLNNTPHGKLTFSTHV